MEILEYIKNNELENAISACKQILRDKPGDVETRGMLAQLLCFSGNWSNADTQLSTVMQQDPEMAIGVGLLRQLIRAESSRQQFFFEGGTPELIGDPSPALEALLKALIASRNGEEEEVIKQTSKINETCPLVAGTVNNEPFEIGRDLDDLLQGFAEVLTSNGKFFLIPWASIHKISFRPPERLQDQIWRSASIEAADNINGEVYLPTRYCTSPEVSNSLSEPLLMGAETNWTTSVEGGPTLGQGLKMFAFGDQAYSIMELNDLSFSN
ncbi:MAG: tetratricopeptide repeat protein [Planctomycetaceae bacterium]|nr:tetratricopeptide repeat protein [Planctomycetaceae bacterium]MCP4478603.1 tetratricopeptide repeat protein [Planctomycetaceae bacterium]MCP4773969.1 tetratricopeptide repeat protein [Planctomycetaceae bacterium]